MGLLCCAELFGSCPNSLLKTYGYSPSENVSFWFTNISDPNEASLDLISYDIQCIFNLVKSAGQKYFILAGSFFWSHSPLCTILCHLKHQHSTVVMPIKTFLPWLFHYINSNKTTIGKRTTSQHTIWFSGVNPDITWGLVENSELVDGLQH